MQRNRCITIEAGELDCVIVVYHCHNTVFDHVDDKRHNAAIYQYSSETLCFAVAKERCGR